jgi:hypothetical protein
MSADCEHRVTAHCRKRLRCFAGKTPKAMI